jgi:hypothetical protein
MIEVSLFQCHQYRTPTSANRPQDYQRCRANHSPMKSQSGEDAFTLSSNLFVLTTMCRAKEKGKEIVTLIVGPKASLSFPVSRGAFLTVGVVLRPKNSQSTRLCYRTSATGSTTSTARPLFSKMKILPQLTYLSISPILVYLTISHLFQWIDKNALYHAA